MRILEPNVTPGPINLIIPTIIVKIKKIKFIFQKVINFIINIKPIKFTWVSIAPTTRIGAIFVDKSRQGIRINRTYCFMW